MKTSTRDLILKQIALQHEMQAKGINLVECGNCGSILLHETPLEEDGFIHCYGCHSMMDACDCPDVFYSGMENNQEFQDNEEIT